MAVASGPRPLLGEAGRAVGDVAYADIALTDLDVAWGLWEAW